MKKIDRRRYVEQQSRADYPPSERPKVRMLQQLGYDREARAISALNKSEADYRELMVEGKSLAEKYDMLKEKMLEFGYLMYDLPVTPDEAGFEYDMEEVVLGKAKIDKLVYRKDDVYLWHVDGKAWCVNKESWPGPLIIDLWNMTDFIIFMRSIGIMLDMEEILMT